MAETLISPGVFLKENDTSQITQGPIAVGAAIVGPTVIGPVNEPTLVTSYTDYKSKFGSLFTSGGASFEYLTSMAAYSYFQQGGESLLVTRVASGSYTYATASVTATAGTAFTLETLSSGLIMNNDFSASLGVISGSLLSGSKEDVRWEVTGADTGSGQFSIIIRRGDDYSANKTVLESWSGLSLDPNSNNYIEYVIGNTYTTPTLDESGNYFLNISGSYANNSRYIRVKSVALTTPNYLNTQGKVSVADYTGSIPTVGSGSLNGAFGGAIGTVSASIKLFDKIPAAPGNDIQGLTSTDYNIALSLLSNKDAYAFKIIFAPGITLQNAPSTANSLISLASNRGDAIAVVDTVAYGQAIGAATSQAISVDNSYAATYWPWVQLRSSETGKLFFCPASTVIPAAYEYNDRVGQEWFAPAGLNRGGLPTVLQPERRISSAQRDTLYQSKVNPIALFPGQGTVIYGQKTLQAKPSALDRVNVRRLLIALKTQINQISQTLLFEPNTQATRNNFLNQVNPYLQYVQQKQGLYAFKVVMDDTNNTPDVIDRNKLIGAIYLQPTKTSEYILIDFNITATGATFGQ
jgi:uncharacterized protein